MGDPQYPYPVFLQWDDDPQRLKKLKNKLLLYFQKRSESNGGECEIRDTDCSRGYILIHFKEEKDRDRVLQKDSHEVKLSGGKKIKLDVRSVGADSEGSPPVDSREDLTPQPSGAEAPSDQSQHVTQEPPSSALILIENLEDSCTSEILNLLVENISEKNVDTDFHVERIPESRSAVVTFTCDIDILRFVENFSRNSRVRSFKMSAKPLEETRSIRVEGLPPNTPEEYISLFFDNPKHGVPGSIEDTLAIPDEDAALVTFSTVEAAKKVLGRKHQFQKKEVSVYPYYPAQDIVLYGDQRPQIPTPEPLTFPVSPHILEFILSNAQLKDNMEKTMGTRTCEIKWSDLLCPNPVITLSFPEAKSTHLRTLARLVPTWKEEVHAEFSRLISKYKVIEYKMDQSVWDAVKEHASSSTYNGVLIKPELGSGKVFLVGLLEDVTRTDPTFRQLVEETTKQVERKSQSTTETLPMSPALYQIMCNSGLQKKILDQVPELKMDYDVPTKAIRLSGLRDEVLTAKCEILLLQNQLETKSTQMNPHLAQSLMSTDEELSRLLSDSSSSHAEKESSGDKNTPDDDVAPNPPYSLVLVKNIQNSCTSNLLNLLVENTSEKIKDKDFYVEIIPEIQSAVVTFTCDIDIPRFIRTFCSDIRVVHNKLTARPLEESRTVRVENVPENTSEMYLADLFGNPKQGGGRVDDIVMLPEERAALITFCDTANVKRVLKKDHVFSKKMLSAYPYYPLLSIALYGKDGPCIEIPKPIEFNISPYILQHICNNEGLKNNIDVKMKDKHCEVKWPDQDCQDPVLQLIFPPTLSTHLRSVTKIVPKWKEEVYNELSLLMSKFRVIEYKMDESVWEAIREHVSSSTYDGVLIKPDFGEEKVFLVGLSEDVTKIDPTFRQLVEETTKQVERKKQTKTETLSMSPALYQIMCNSGLKKKILDQVPELKMDYDVPTKRARLSGLKDEVLTAKSEILNITQQMKSKSIQMNRHLVQFLISNDNEELSSLLFVHHINTIDDGVVKLMAHSEEDLTVAENQIKEKLLHKEVLVEDKSLLKSPEWRSLRSHLLQLFNAEKITVLIEESSSGMEDNVVITGLTSNVLKCFQQVCDFLEKNTTIETEIPVKPSAKMTFICEERKEILENIKKNVKVTKNQNSICLSGPQVKVQEAANVIGNILHSLHSNTLRIEKPGAKKFCKVNEEVHAATARTAYHCVIRLEEDDVENDLFGKSRFQVTLPNGMTLSVYKGNMCRHNVDVIVNAANEQLKHGGGLAKAILDASGRKLQDDCDQIIRKNGRLSTGDSVITDAGNLPCRQIIHTVGPRWKTNLRSECERLLRRAITTSLQLASEKSHSSIAIPAVSSGIFGFPIKLCVENIVEAIRVYIETPGQQSTLQRIHLVDMKEETINAFCEVIKAKFGNQMSAVPPTAMASQPVTRAPQSPPAPVNRGDDNTVMTKEGLKTKPLQKNIEVCSAFTSQLAINTDAAASGATGSNWFRPSKAPTPAQKLSAFQLMDGIEPVVFSLCAEDKRSVDRAKAWLQKLINNEKAEKEFREECISELEEAEVQKIYDLGKKFQVSVTYKPADSSIQIVGLARNVLPASGEIETFIIQVKDRKNRERAAELTGNLVEWRYDNGGTMVPFDKMTNLELEEAKNDNKVQITIQIQGHQYTVNVQGETAIDKHGNQIQIQRVLKHDGESHKLPSHWKAMDTTLVMEVDVAPGTPEYSAVQQKFQRTCSKQILKILRVQNRHLWDNYQTKKKTIDSKNGSTTNERELFHGTDFKAIQNVNHYGFNRSYAGKNAAVNGNGTYFTVNANYSGSHTFSKPDGNGQRHMYLARVLTGLYCTGRKGMIAPPAKDTANPTDLYDSVTDDVQNPSIFVIFNDVQAYPEYHIIFQ